MNEEKCIINDSTTHIIKREQELKLPDAGEIIPDKPLVLSKESFKSEFFLISTVDNDGKITYMPQQVGPQLINEIVKMVANLNPGERTFIRALAVDTKEEIEQRNKVLPEVELND